MRRALFVVLCLLVMPATAAATEASVSSWRHASTPEACLSGASAAMAVSGLTTILSNPEAAMVSGHAGEYVAVALCIDQTASLTVAGPSEAVARSLHDRVRAAWR